MKTHNISDSEWIVLESVWDLGTATANQVVDSLASKVHWKPKTIHTFLNRLVAKGSLVRTKNGREFTYQAVHSKTEVTHLASRSFLDKYFNGGLAPFLSTFVKKENLSRKEINRLKKLLEDIR